MPKPYPQEFRDDVVAVARKGQAPLSQIAKDFGISEGCLHNWMKRADVADGNRPGTTVAEMPRSGKESFCCGAGGARMWMEEDLGTRINANRTEEAVATLTAAGAGTAAKPGAIATGCPFCRTMLTDGVDALPDGTTAAPVEVLDVAQLLLESVRREPEARASV